MLAMAGQDLDQFMKEMEQVHKRNEAEKQVRFIFEEDIDLTLIV